VRICSPESFRKWSDQVKNGPFKMGYRCVQLFFIDFELFYYLLRIIPATYGIGNTDLG
jgi:hypothetical protein